MCDRNPNGVASPSPRLPYSATLGTREDIACECVIATPTGLRPSAQGCRTRLPWGTRGERRPTMCDRNPNGVASPSPRLPYSATLGTRRTSACECLIATPTGLRPSAQGCRTRLPWERGERRPTMFDRSPNGVACENSRLPSGERGRRTTFKIVWRYHASIAFRCLHPFSVLHQGA